jgi:hypothetical protein
LVLSIFFLKDKGVGCQVSVSWFKGSEVKQQQKRLRCDSKNMEEQPEARTLEPLNPVLLNLET